jgi:phosphatidylserine decarboxylase
MRKCNDEVYQLAKDQALVKKLKTKRFRPSSRLWFLVIYVTITDGHMTIFPIRLQTLMKLVGQAKYSSI